MTAPSLRARPGEAPRLVEQPARLEWSGGRRAAPPSGAWSFTACSDPGELDSVLVVYRLALSKLGIEDLAADVARRGGATEARRWRHEQARDYVLQLIDQLRRHLATTEFIIHAADDARDDHLQVVVTLGSGDRAETERLEQEIADRVQAIAKRVWIGWSESVRLSAAARQARAASQ